MLKDLIQNDVTNIFLNEDELGEKHSLDGVDIVCIIDDSIDNTLGVKNMQYSEGVYTTSVNLYVKDGYIEFPDIGQQIELDGKLYSVVKAVNNIGIFEILLEAYDS